MLLLRFLVGSQCVTVLLVCPGWPPDVSVCWTHGLLFVVGAMCSHVYCLSHPLLLTNHCFSGSTCVSLVTLVCLPILASWCLQSCADPLSSFMCLTACVLCWLCKQFSTCLPVFPLRGGFCSFVFHFMIKTTILLHLSPRLRLFSWSLTERISQMRTQRRMGSHRPAAPSTNVSSNFRPWASYVSRVLT